jgi:thioredoxin-like negative regulator of GroEL
MTPIVDGLEAEFDGKVDVFQLDANETENAALHAEYRLRGHPAFAVLDETGFVTARFFGPQTADTLREAMTAVCGSACES